MIVGRVVPAATLFKLPQRLDSVVRNDEQVGVFVYVLQNLSKNLVKGAVLVGERIHTNALQLGVVAYVVGLNGI